MTHPNETPEPLAQGQAGEMAIRDLCVGRVEWHCSTDDGAYCMSFDRDNSRDPEREAAEWLERHQRDYPHRFMAYKVRRVVVQSQLQEEALALLSRLSDATAALQAKDAEIARLKADAGRYRWLRERDWFNSDLCVLREPKRVLTRGIGLGADCPSHNRLDEAIDAAMKGEAA